MLHADIRDVFDDRFHDMASNNRAVLNLANLMLFLSLRGC